MSDVIETDYLVVGAGAAGMAITDALLSHSAVNVTIIDRRNAPGGHWLDAYPFVRLHQHPHSMAWIRCLWAKILSTALA